jgi:4-amino-4-deoxy-L-arabinose transferase-like glycosyltransferase
MDKGKRMNGFSEVRIQRVIRHLVMISISVLTISILVLSSVPPVNRDELTHHLAIPKLYLEHGGIYEIPSIKFSYYPMNMELLYLIPLFFGNDIIPKYIHFSFALFTAVLIYHYLRKRIDNLYGSLGALFFLSIPMIVKLSITVYVDLGLIFFSFASLLLMMEWCNKGYAVRLLFLSAICCGLAMGTKYNALILFVLISLFVPFVYIRSAPVESSSSFAAIRHAIFFVVISVLCFSPWMIRNYAWKKNPVYPLYHQFFSKPMAEKGKETGKSVSIHQTGKKLEPIAIRKFVYKESWWQTASIPIRIFFQGEDDNPKYFDGKLNPFLFLLPFFAFYGNKKRGSPLHLVFEMKIMFGFSVLFLLVALFTHDIRIRYISPIIPPLVVLSMFGLRNLVERVQQKRPFFQYAVPGVIICWMIWMNAGYVIDQFRCVEPMTYLTGQVDRDQYIEKYRPEYAVMKYANQKLPKNAVILPVFTGNRYYYSDRKMVFNFSLFAKIIKETDRPEEVLSELKKRGITHIMIGYELFNAWANNNFSKQEKIFIERFFHKQILYLYSKNGYGLYQVE